MAVPKLIGEVSDAFGFDLIMRVECCLNCEKRSHDAELRMKLDLGKFPQIALCEAGNVPEPAENSRMERIVCLRLLGKR
jgi:hypothetical protein